MRGATVDFDDTARFEFISIHAPHAGRDSMTTATRREAYISIHAPHAGRDLTSEEFGNYLGISIHAPHAGRDSCQLYLAAGYLYFNPRAPCGARLEINELPHPRDHNFNPRAPCGARRHFLFFGMDRNDFNPRAPCGARHHGRGQAAAGRFISIHAPHAGRDDDKTSQCGYRDISIHAPHAGRDTCHGRSRRTNIEFQSTRPMRGATCEEQDHPRDTQISIHAPHAGRDSKSIQNYFKHFCDKRQFLDNFTQNTAFQSVLPLADRQKLLYLRCEPLRKFLRAFASHYKIIGSSGR